MAELLVRRQGVLPIASVEDLAAVDDAFESDEEYEAFIADLYASRRAGLRCASSLSTTASPRQSSSDSDPVTSRQVVGRDSAAEPPLRGVRA